MSFICSDKNRIVIEFVYLKCLVVFYTISQMLVQSHNNVGYWMLQLYTFFTNGLVLILLGRFSLFLFQEATKKIYCVKHFSGNFTMIYIPPYTFTSEILHVEWSIQEQNK